MSEKKPSAGDPSFGDSIRSQVYRMSSGVIGWPPENVRPDRRLKVHDRPSLDTVGRSARPATTWSPGWPARSGKVTSGVQVANAISHVVAKYHRVGSRGPLPPNGTPRW